QETKIDILSILFSTVGFGGTLYGFTNLQETGISHISTIISLAVGIVAISLFVIRQLRLKTPILEVRVLKTPIFSLVAVISIVAFSLLIAVETIMPLFVQNAQSNTAYYAGLVVMPGALTLAIMSFVAGKLFDKYGGKEIVIVGFVLMGLSA